VRLAESLETEMLASKITNSWAAIVCLGLLSCLGISTRAEGSVFPTTLTFLPGSQNPAFVGNPETFTASLFFGTIGFPGVGPVQNVTIDFENVTLSTTLGSATTNLTGVAMVTVTFASPGVFDIRATFLGDDNFQGAMADTTVTVDAVNAGATPLPAALPLFATGLGVLGLLGWRRKRKLAA
jgi:hypothetical protein